MSENKSPKEFVYKKFKKTKEKENELMQCQYSLINEKEN